ncbi:hypothetical protein SAMN04488515_1853 [Cognatiyoonia koreensis]|uniref:Polyketide cyclase / dehydrase and lipid transport n=1 Tax=Cognatiyoonia koreensis TaxID=364200 RepID=A0A1I0QEK2_9RHOB|nr:hypothetical protein [Cognatiyoonia koreensis]SEW25322.1 hypothetical protein SAMN04488515_1853 [Cognatiyoonia koreensis]
MTSSLWYQEKAVFAAAIEDVYAALFAQSRAQPGGDPLLLDVRDVSGTPGTAGFVQQARVNDGALDLILLETIIAIEPPRHLQVRQLPDALVRHDPGERDAPFLGTLVDDLDVEFTRKFGDPPAHTDLIYDLATVDSGTEVTITIDVPGVAKAGWLQRRFWRKAIRKEVARIKARITQAVA